MCHTQEHPELSWRQKMLLEFRAERKVLADNIQRLLTCMLSVPAVQADRATRTCSAVNSAAMQAALRFVAARLTDGFVEWERLRQRQVPSMCHHEAP